MQFQRHSGSIARVWTRIAPPKSCTVIGNDAGNLGNRRADEFPRETDPTCTGVEDNSGTPCALNMHVQPITSNVDHLSDGRVLLLEAGFGARDCSEENADRNSKQDR